MKKQILNLGKALNKAQQKSINGGAGFGDGAGSLKCYCSSGGIYEVGHCQWCGWMCGASTILKCE